jgi:hypothetical protein
LGRWTSADPLGLVDGPNLYRYARNAPVVMPDPTGKDPPDPREYNNYEAFAAAAPAPYSDDYLRSVWDAARAEVEPTQREQEQQQSLPSEHADINIESALRTVSPIPRSAVRFTDPHIDPSPTRRGIVPTDTNAPVRPAEHALGEHRASGGRGRSPYTSASMNPRGAPNIQGSQRLYIDIDRAVAEGAEFISEADLARDMQQLASENPQRYSTRAELWRGAQEAGEREVLFRGRISPSAIDTPGMRALRHGGRALQVYGAAMTVYDMGAATVESVETGSPRPVVAESVRQVGSWGGAWLGFKAGAAAGALAGIETGPGAVVTALAGGVVFGAAGYFGADWVADFIYEN